MLAYLVGAVEVPREGEVVGARGRGARAEELVGGVERDDEHGRGAGDLDLPARGQEEPERRRRLRRHAADPPRGRRRRRGTGGLGFLGGEGREGQARDGHGRGRGQGARRWWLRDGRGRDVAEKVEPVGTAWPSSEIGRLGPLAREVARISMCRGNAGWDAGRAGPPDGRAPAPSQNRFSSWNLPFFFVFPSDIGIFPFSENVNCDRQRPRFSPLHESRCKATATSDFLSRSL